ELPGGLRTGQAAAYDVHDRLIGRDGLIGCGRGGNRAHGRPITTGEKNSRARRSLDGSPSLQSPRGVKHPVCRELVSGGGFVCMPGSAPSDQLPPAAASMTPESRRLLEALWTWRRDHAAQAGSAPHVVLQDRVLVDIALNRPTTLGDLAELEGFGQARLDQYGAAVLKVIRAQVFSPTDAAFLGFRFVKERPNAVAAWAAVSLVFNLLSAFVGLVLGGQALRTFQAQAGKIDDLQAVFQLLIPAAPALIAIAIITLAGMAMVYSSALRLFL